MHGPARYLAPCVAALLLGSTTGIAVGADGARGELAALRTSERSAVLELYATEAALARASAELDRQRRHEDALGTARDRALLRSSVLRDSLAGTQARIATLLRRLYVEGTPEPVAVVLGARSLQAVLEGIDGLEQATRRNRELARKARSRGAAVRLELARLARARDALAESRTQTEELVRRLEAATLGRRQTIAALRRRESLSRAKVEALESRARMAADASDRLNRRSLPVRPSTVLSPAASDADDLEPVDAAVPADQVGSERTLVVDAVAYHLPGHTASGLPVGVGVIAVDPSVIPLGTRVFVPGYGPAVAADVGSAIKGNTIDLWMPSTSAARAWGRRTVTITVYG